MNLESLSRASKICTIMIGIGFIGTIIVSLIGWIKTGLFPIFSIICILFTGILFGSAIYMDIKNGRWKDGFSL